MIGVLSTQRRFRALPPPPCNAMSSESQTAERPALSTELIPPTPGISGAAGEEEQTPFFAPRRRSLTLVDVDSAGALRPLTQAPSLTEVVQSFVGGRRGSVHSEDGDVQRPAAHRTDSTLARVLRGTLRRFTPEPSEGPLDEDFDREPDLTPPEAVHLTVDAVAATSTLDSATPGSSDILSPENHVETLDRSHLEPPSVPSPGRRRRQSWVELAADRMMSAILPKDAFEFDLSIHHSEDEKKFLGSYTAEDLKKWGPSNVDETPLLTDHSFHLCPLNTILLFP